MNKSDLIEAVSKVTSTKKEANAAVEAVIETITKALKKKQSFGIPTTRLSSRMSSSR